MSRVTRHISAFTLAEVLAAMLFLAIVIPAAVEALHVASLAGEVAARKGAAARIGRPDFERKHRDDQLEQRARKTEPSPKARRNSIGR